MIIPPRRQRLIEMVGKLLATEKWHWMETHPLEERPPKTNPSRSMDYAATALGCYYMLGQCGEARVQFPATVKYFKGIFPG